MKYLLTRDQAIDAIEKIRLNPSNVEMIEKIEDILIKYGADMEDDTDPEEGFYASMYSNDIRMALDDIRDLVGNAPNGKYSLAESEILQLGYKRDSVSDIYGNTVSFFTRDDIGIVVCSAMEAKSLAKKILYAMKLL